jgi:hypothetical protein
VDGRHWPVVAWGKEKFEISFGGFNSSLYFAISLTGSGFECVQRGDDAQFKQDFGRDDICSSRRNQNFDFFPRNDCFWFFSPHSNILHKSKSLLPRTSWSLVTQIVSVLLIKTKGAGAYLAQSVQFETIFFKRKLKIGIKVSRIVFGATSTAVDVMTFQFTDL